MNVESRVSVRWPVLVLAAGVCVAVGAGVAYVSLRSNAAARPSVDEQMATTMPSMAGGAPAEPRSSSDPSGTLEDVVVALGQEAAERAGITVTPVVTDRISEALRVPGVVEANAYKQVVVTPVVGGRITSVTADLGQQVREGQSMAQIFSPELAEAEMRYISVRAELAAHGREVARTEELAAIGAASRQELERTHAVHAAHLAGLESAASSLQLIGLSAEEIAGLGSATSQGATINVPAPLAGVVTERLANVGLNVDQATPLFTVVDLSSVWVIVEVYETDFHRVGVGTSATVTTQAYPDRMLRGRVSYVDPQVSPTTRTAKARIEVPNPGHDLRLGMFAEAVLEVEGGVSMPMVPRSAVQNVGDRTVVYLAEPNQEGTFMEREVRLGPVMSDHVSVLAGVQVGDVVVEQGSFAVRAERERLGLRAAPSSASDPVSGVTNGSRTMQEASVTVTDTGFEPQRIVLREGVAARVTFTRTSETTCATEVVFPSLNIRRGLPLNQPVAIDFTPDKVVEIGFACGLNMLKGVVVVE
jgi:RND family efflux transporter MFP subunit